MNAGRIIREIMRKQNLSITALSRRIDLNDRTLGNRLRLPNVTEDKIVQVLKGLDYKLVIVPASRRLEEDEYEIK